MSKQPWELSDEEIMAYHYAMEPSQAFFDRQMLQQLVTRANRGTDFSQHQLESLISIASINMHSTYIIQEIKAIIEGKRINKLECEIDRSFERGMYELRRSERRDCILETEIINNRE